ncbi:HXXEE domain-containing protein [Streptococcus sp. sy018]|uniref:HXXEE domain-containing protein n=1 Tax=Streptococcus sp. sy018 TaxID=2600147 RepID=UPI0011B76158|nr:HXXEE domain-containing protein [Streptococcus sp. sy018]TWS94661.1 HXXEE domain-containing protein [Streptococcus sp. sy018]
MKWYLNNWYYIGGIIFAVLSLLVSLFGHQLPLLQRLMIIQWLCLLLHQFEEYALPGGFPSAWNIGMSGEVEKGDRYPLNTKSAFVVNICCAYPLFISGILFSQVIMLDLFITYFNLAQVIVHGFIMNKKMKTIYNPGLASVIFAMLPIGLYTLYIIQTTVQPTMMTWLLPALFFVPIAFLMIMLPILLFKDKNTSYAFLERDVKGFSIENKVARIRR